MHLANLGVPLSHLYCKFEAPQYLKDKFRIYPGIQNKTQDAHKVCKLNYFNNAAVFLTLVCSHILKLTD